MNHFKVIHTFLNCFRISKIMPKDFFHAVFATKTIGLIDNYQLKNIFSKTSLNKTLFANFANVKSFGTIKCNCKPCFRNPTAIIHTYRHTKTVYEDIHIFLSCFSIYHISFFGKDLKGTEWNLNFEEKVIYLFVKAWYTEGKNFRLRPEFSRTKKD